MKNLRFVLDQSTSGTKLLLVDASADVRVIDRLDRKHQQFYPQNGWVEHDPLEIMNNVYELITAMLTKHQLNYAQIASLSITNQRETIAFWNKKTGEPLYNAIVWQCGRGTELCKALVAAGYEQLIQEKTGLRLDTYFSGSKILWAMEHVPAIQKALACDELAIGTMDSWLIWNLTGGATFATESSNACRTLLYNIHTLTWDEELCQLFKVRPQALPTIQSSDSLFGYYQGIPITGIMADSQSALFGQHCTQAGEVKATLGTGCSVMMQVAQSAPVQNEKILTTIAWQEQEQVNYALEGIIRSFGDTMNWFGEGLQLFNDVTKGSEAAFSLASNEGVYFIPAQLGLGAPFWLPEAQAMFLGLSRSSTRAHLIRAGFESMAFSIRAVLDEMEKVSGLKVAAVKVDGGATKNPAFMQLIADVLQKKIVVGTAEELSALGVVALITKHFLDGQNVKTFFPKKEYQKEYRHWFNCIEKNLG